MRLRTVSTKLLYQEFTSLKPVRMGPVVGFDAGGIKRHREGALRGAGQIGHVIGPGGGGRRDVAVEEHRQAQRAAQHVRPGDAHVSRQLVLHRHLAFMHQRIHPIRLPGRAWSASVRAA